MVNIWTPKFFGLDGVSTCVRHEKDDLLLTLSDGERRIVKLRTMSKHVGFGCS
jgi:hypothetical protein